MGFFLSGSVWGRGVGILNLWGGRSMGGGLHGCLCDVCWDVLCSWDGNSEPCGAVYAQGALCSPSYQQWVLQQGALGVFQVSAACKHLLCNHSCFFCLFAVVIFLAKFWRISFFSSCFKVGNDSSAPGQCAEWKKDPTQHPSHPALQPHGSEPMQLLGEGSWRWVLGLFGGWEVGRGSGAQQGGDCECI